jgi:hypothetical protein
MITVLSYSLESDRKIVGHQALWPSLDRELFDIEEQQYRVAQKGNARYESATR